MVKSCKLYTVAFRTESWDIAVCEALASGLPVVACDLPVHRELFAGGMKLVPVGDVDDYATRVVALLEEDDERRAALAVEGKEVARKYDWGLIAERERGIFEAIIVYSQRIWHS